jgi:hypothetical protein
MKVFALLLLVSSSVYAVEGDVAFVSAFPLDGDQGYYLELESAGARSLSRFWSSCVKEGEFARCFMRVTAAGALVASEKMTPASPPVDGTGTTFPVEEEIEGEITLKFRSAIAEPLLKMIAAHHGVSPDTREPVGEMLACKMGRMRFRGRIYAPLVPGCEVKFSR